LGGIQGRNIIRKEGFGRKEGLTYWGFRAPLRFGGHSLGWARNWFNFPKTGYSISGFEGNLDYPNLLELKRKPGKGRNWRALRWANPILTCWNLVGAYQGLGNI